MATSGTFTGNRGGNSTGPWLELDWARREIDIPNNRSLIRLTLRLHASHSLYFSAGKSGILHGSSFTYTGGFSGTGSKVLRTRDVWVNHNADGSKSQSFSASFNIAVSWGGSTLSSISVSGVASITAIPRASTLSAFSFASSLKPGSTVNLNYTIDRKSTAFRHQIQLRDGTHVVQTWDNVSSDGASSVQLSTASVYDLLDRMSNVTSRALTLRVATRSGVGGSWIGGAVTRNATASIDASVKPVVSALTIGQTGNTVSSHYLQGISRVYGHFTSSEGYGSTLTNTSITVRRKTTNNDIQTIDSDSGTTDNPVSRSGTYEARGMARDSRGRTTYTAWVEFTVTPYTSPVITNFTADRRTATPTTVDISRAGTHTHLGGSNVLTYTVQRRIGTGSWTNVNTNATGTSSSASFTGTSRSTSNSVTTSYEFRMIITDEFGESAESIITVSTQRVVLDIHKNEGVGIGKVHERGVLDVNGTIYTDGQINLQNSDYPENEIALISHTLTGGNPGIEIASVKDPHGYAYIDFNTTRPNNAERGGDSRIIASHGNSVVDNEGIMRLQSGDVRLDASRDIELNGRTQMIGSVFVNGEGIASYHTNSLGSYIRFYNGIQICWNNTTIDSGIGYNRNGRLMTSNNLGVTYPSAFIGFPAITVTGNVGGLHASFATANLSNNNEYFGLRFMGEDYSTNVGRYNYIAIGRWK